jgi:hypothetical protein
MAKVEHSIHVVVTIADTISASYRIPRCTQSIVNMM